MVHSQCGHLATGRGAAGLAHPRNLPALSPLRSDGVLPHCERNGEIIPARPHATRWWAGGGRAGGEMPVWHPPRPGGGGGVQMGRQEWPTPRAPPDPSSATLPGGAGRARPAPPGPRRARAGAGGWRACRGRATASPRERRPPPHPRLPHATGGRGVGPTAPRPRRRRGEEQALGWPQQNVHKILDRMILWLINGLIKYHGEPID